MQIIKPKTLGLISKTYNYKTHTCAIGALGFFKLTEEQQPENNFLAENTSWSKITSYLGNAGFLDMGFAKPRAEVLVAGKAFTPEEKPLEKMSVSLSFGNIKKSIKVIGDRHWSARMLGVPSKPTPFTEHGLGYEYAYGGTGYAENPLGKGVISPENRDKETGLFALPNLFYSGDNTSADKKTRRVACFAPLDIMWPQRSMYQGSYDQQWLEKVHPGFPHDTNPRLFNAAPDDQQIDGFFKPCDMYTINGMHPKTPQFKGCIPKFKVRAFVNQTSGDGDQFHELETYIDTVWFFPELEIGVVIYRATTKVNDSDGLDIKQLLLAYERQDDVPRSVDYYKEALSLRTDPKTAAGHALNEAQLKPEKTDAELAHIQSLYQQAKLDHNEKKEKVLDQLVKTKQISPEQKTQAIAQNQDDDFEPIPQALIDSGDIDLSPFVKQGQELTEKAQRDMTEKLAQLEDTKKALIDKAKPQDVETLSSIQQRVFNPLYIYAQELEENSIHHSDSNMAEDTTQPASVVALKSSLPEVEIEKLQQQGKLDALAQADKLTQQSLRQARQTAPECTVLSEPLSDEGQQQIRHWVLEMLEAGKSLAGRDLAGADLSHINFTGQDLRDVMFERCDLSACCFDACRLDGAVLTEAIISGCSFSGASLTHANISKVECREIGFRLADLSEANMASSHFIDCDFCSATLNKVKAIETELTGSLFNDVQCAQGQFIQACLRKTNWHNAQLSECTFLQGKLQDSSWQGAKLYRCLMIETQARNVDFSNVDMEMVQFSNQGDFQEAVFAKGRWKTCGFRGVNLQSIDAVNAIFIECDFGEADLNGANFRRAMFYGCIMMQANFKKNDCREALFNETMLRKSTFDHVDCRDAKIHNCDLTEVEFVHCKDRGMTQSPVASIG